jgi:hypothetical protein
MPRSNVLARLRARGFDRAYHIPFTKTYHVGCSQCAALAINGVACHETGCPRATRECKGCAAIVPARVEYCEDCRG